MLSNETPQPRATIRHESTQKSTFNHIEVNFGQPGQPGFQEWDGLAAVSDYTHARIEPARWSVCPGGFVPYAPTVRTDDPTAETQS